MSSLIIASGECGLGDMKGLRLASVGFQYELEVSSGISDGILVILA